MSHTLNQCLFKMLLLTLLSFYFVGASAFVLPPILRKSGRIVGGVETTIDDRPFSVSLQYLVGNQYYHSCGGSILNANYVLTAAHCFIPETYYARVGTTTFATGGQVIEVINFQQHPLYNSNIMDYDVAVLSLAREIEFGPNVAPTVLPTSSDPEPLEIATVSGWGVTDESDSEASPVLRKVDLPVWDNDWCFMLYYIITPRHICLGGTPAGGASACFGDSGGPATYNGVQIGTVSGGSSCSDAFTPGIFARISVMLDWIKEQAQMS